MPLSILAAAANRPELRAELTGQLTADGHNVHQAHHSRHATVLLAGRHVDMLILGALERPSAALALLRELRAGTLDPRAWPELPTITLAPLVGDGELDALRAYEAGSDHHLPCGAEYLHQRAVLQALARPARAVTRRVHRVGAIEIDTAAREVRVAGTRVELSAMELALLTALAADLRRVFTKDELLRDVWGFQARGRTRTLDSHACRLRRKLSDHGAHAVVNVWRARSRRSNGLQSAFSVGSGDRLRSGVSAIRLAGLEVSPVLGAVERASGATQDLLAEIAGLLGRRHRLDGGAAEELGADVLEHVAEIVALADQDDEHQAAARQLSNR